MGPARLGGPRAGRAPRRPLRMALAPHVPVSCAGSGKSCSEPGHPSAAVPGDARHAGLAPSLGPCPSACPGPFKNLAPILGFLGEGSEGAAGGQAEGGLGRVPGRCQRQGSSPVSPTPAGSWRHRAQEGTGPAQTPLRSLGETRSASPHLVGRWGVFSHGGSRHLSPLPGCTQPCLCPGPSCHGRSCVWVAPWVGGSV